MVDRLTAGRGDPVAVGESQSIGGVLSLCRNAFHGALDPTKWRGDRWWVVALHEPVVADDQKMGSLRRTIIADLGRCPF
jgi:hypothetical protein